VPCVVCVRMSAVYDVDVQALSLDGNQIAIMETKAFHRISGLLSLALQNNNISSLERSLFSDLNHLNTLLLQNNQLPGISPETFDELVSLTYVDLSSNRLKSDHIPPAFLRRSTKLRNVYLDDNQLKTIDSCMLATHHRHTVIRTLSLLGNPINCDCSLRWLLHLRYVSLSQL